MWDALDLLFELLELLLFWRLWVCVGLSLLVVAVIYSYLPQPEARLPLSLLVVGVAVVAGFVLEYRASKG
jgi:uncharacterized BrkB/YihY/UPF0761 family membrane protein